MNFLASKNKTLGFTLIELLVAATIIILLTTIGVVSYQTAARNSRNAKRKADLETVRQAMIMYRSENGVYPTGDFNGIVAELYSEDYLTEYSFTDPRSPDYDYAYDGSTLQAILEPYDDAETYEVRLP